MKILFFAIVSTLLLVPAAHAQYRMKYPNSYYHSENWPRHTLRLTKEGSLKDIFDAGFRLHYWPGFDSRRLEFKHANITLQETGGRHLPEFPVEYADIRVKPSGISRIDLISQPFTIEQARNEMEKWLPYIKKTREQLDEFLKEVDADPAGYDDPNFGKAPKGFSGGWADANDLLYGVHFQKAYNARVPVCIYLSVDWYRLRTDKDRRTFYRDPIPVPEGYEDRPITVGKGFGPDSTSEMMHAKGIPFLPGRGLGGSVTDVIELNEDGTPGRHVRGTPPAQKPEPVKPLPPIEKPAPVPWWAIPVGIVVLLAAAAIIAWRRKRAHDPQ